MGIARQIVKAGISRLSRGNPRGAVEYGCGRSHGGIKDHNGIRHGEAECRTCDRLVSKIDG